MLIVKQKPISGSEITDQAVFLKRREFLQRVGSAAILSPLALSAPVQAGAKIANIKKSPYRVDEELTSFEKITQYNNFYEFGTDKSDPAEYAKTLKTKPWSLAIEGEVEKPGVYQLEDFIKPYQLEERIYRFRCVEAWSMVVPWVGFPLAEVLKQFKPTSKAKYIEFTTLNNPEQMPGQKRDVIPWPYVEGLRMDEAMHPLTILVVGVYGEILPNQNGAPLRLIVPWKYGFKSIKSIVKIRFTEQQPLTAWNKIAPNEYGFYANVNPEVDHPRWSQKTERKLGEFFKHETLMFNGYAEEVASLYAGMDLAKNF